MKASTATIRLLLAELLTKGVPAARASRDRALMRETVLRIRQLQGILELRSR